MNVLVYGGSGSGKSEFAENYISQKKNNSKLIYLATLDSNSGGDTKKRIENHRKMREGKGFETVELEIEKNELKTDFLSEKCFILLEDAGNLVSRVVFSDFEKLQRTSCGELTEFFVEKIAGFLQQLFLFSEDIVIVSNDIFLEKISGSDKGMKVYFQTLSKVNQFLSEKCGLVFRVVAGIPVEIKGLE